MVLGAFYLIATAACGSVPQVPAEASPSGDAALNVRGTIDRSFVPPCPTDEPCDPPITGAYLVFSQPGKAEIRTSVGADGSFVLHLDPGAYSISTAPPPMGGRVEPNGVRVPATGTVELQLKIVRTPA